MSGGVLVIVPTPIGNLGDITKRAASALQEADVICCEDTRVTSKLLQALGIPSQGRLRRLDENVIRERADQIIEEILSGSTVAYCSDAGMPGISDPGLALVRTAQKAGAKVEVLPGPSAAVAAYVSSGIDCPRYFFCGFLSRKKGEAARQLEAISHIDCATIIYESPKRLVSTLELLAEMFPTREVSVCRELTKLHEEVVASNASEVLEAFRQRESQEGTVRGEIVVVLGPPTSDEEASEEADALEQARAIASKLLDEGVSPKECVKSVSRETGVSRNDAYSLVLDVRDGMSGDLHP